MEKYPLLSTIQYPSDLRRMRPEKLPELCAELRTFIIESLSENPGHLASSLGAIELTVALHYVFATPDDRIVWDVGHQAYAHKILTGRRERFYTNRKFKGISGFPNPKESKYDAFVAGHASNSISAALGMSIADERLNENRKVVAVIGDGAMTGGLAFEGLNNACVNPNNLLIVLNDNNMSIDNPVGGLNQYLNAITTSPFYNKLRFKVYHLLKKVGWIDENRRGRLTRRLNAIKIGGNGTHNIFEGLNIRYFGQVDGHDVCLLVKVLNDIKNFNGPKVLHLLTQKGKGYAPAENAASVWHAPGRFNMQTGERIVSKSPASRYQDVFGETLLELARANDKIVGITPAMPTGCSMSVMMREMPDRVFDVGIAEAHAVTFSAGLAKEGLVPFCNIYSSFLQRAYDQTIHDVALQNLPFVLCIDRAGLVGSDGPTHHGAFDLAFLRPIPNWTIAAPMNEIELRNLLYTAQLPGHGPIAIRYPRGCGEGLDWRRPFEAMELGKGECLVEGEEVAVLSVGPLGNRARRAVGRLQAEGKHPGLYNMRFVKPLDEALLLEVAGRYHSILTVEDGCLQGGFGSAVLEFLADKGCPATVRRIGLPDQFVEHGTQDELYRMLGMDEEGIYNALNALFK
ncbi:MAG: 1-deoxy-D-xylulose-5-phosphate synthase [Paludibacteraceae bacterium]|nr:1-deoxy-D-xylulose-5-phosphate synthase [Paludibacteraceae bacterium]